MRAQISGHQIIRLISPGGRTSVEVRAAVQGDGDAVRVRTERGHEESTAFATSAVAATRPSGIRPRSLAAWLSSASRTASVRTQPGQIAFAVIPRGPSSRARQRARLTMPAFETA